MEQGRQKENKARPYGIQSHSHAPQRTVIRFCGTRAATITADRSMQPRKNISSVAVVGDRTNVRTPGRTEDTTVSPPLTAIAWGGNAHHEKVSGGLAKALGSKQPRRRAERRGPCC
uniref:Uncharacterized protein n=1 Tax=Steinernema glaseri TaxID=37863 RepID=A0A1I7ZYZ3_9BILA